MQPVKHPLLIGILIILSVTISAQKKSNTPQTITDTCIVLDAINCCANVKVAHYVKEGARLSVKIRNVNPMAAKLQKVITSADTISFGDFPAIFNLAFEKTDNTPPATNLSEVAKHLDLNYNLLNTLLFDDSGKLKKGNIKKNKAQAKKIEQEIAELEKKKAAINLQECYSELQNDIYTLQVFLNLEPRIRGILSTPICSKEDLRKRIIKELNCFKPACDTCCCWYQEKYISLIKSIREKFNCIDTNYTYLTSGAKKQTKIKVSGELKVENASLKINEQELTIEGDKPTSLDKNYNKIKDLVNSIFTDSVSKIMDAKVANLTSMCNDFNSIDSFWVCQNIPEVTGDIYKINPIYIKGPKGDTVWQMPDIKLMAYGGHRLNFSTGIGFSFFGLDKAYFKEKNPGDTLFTVRRTNAKNWNWVLPSVTAFIHSYFKKAGTRWQPAWTLGISTNPASIESTRFFAGASLIQGESRRFIISGGITAGPVSVLKGRFKEDNAYKYSDFSGIEDADLTEKRIRLNVFFGISYNLSNKR